MSLVLKVMKNNRDFVDVILIYVWVGVCSKSHGLLVYEKTYCKSAYQQISAWS